MQPFLDFPTLGISARDVGTIHLFLPWNILNVLAKAQLSIFLCSRPLFRVSATLSVYPHGIEEHVTVWLHFRGIFEWIQSISDCKM